MNHTKTAEAAPALCGRHACDAVLFAPLRIEHGAEGGYLVMTRLDNALGTRNNFAVADCQCERDAQFFACAPELLTTLKQIAAMLTQPVQFTGIRNGASCDILRGDTKAAVELADAAIARVEGQA